MKLSKLIVNDKEIDQENLYDTYGNFVEEQDTIDHSTYETLYFESKYIKTKPLQYNVSLDFIIQATDIVSLEEKCRHLQVQLNHCRFSTFSNSDILYDCMLSSCDRKLYGGRVAILKCSFKAYKLTYGSEFLTKSGTININSAFDVPLVINMQLAVDTPELKINSMILVDLKKDDKVCIDGEKGIVTINDIIEVSKIKFLDFPAGKGSYVINTNTENEMTINYMGRW